MKVSILNKNLVGVIFSRLVSLASSMAVGLLLPKILSVEDYGYLKIFTLYSAYTALLHFGFADGILLKIAGKDYNELDFQVMRTYTRFFSVFECIITGLMLLVGTLFLRGEHLFILVMLALDMLFVNITTYYQFVSQGTQRFAEYSQKSIIVAIAKLIFIGVLFVVFLERKSTVSYRTYLIGLCSLDFLMLIWYVWIYRDITFGKSTGIKEVKNAIINIFKTGIILTIAYQVSHLILALDRQFVSVLYSTEKYAIYSFAYNIVTMISTVISSISVVLLPMLKKAGTKYAVENYKKSLIIVSVLLGFSLLAYFPVQIFIGWFLPEYTQSISYIAIVLPSILFSSGISVVMFTIDKVIDTIDVFFKNSLIILVLGAISNLLAYKFFGTMFSISCASLLIMAVWYLLESNHIRVKSGVSAYKEFIYIVLLISAFLAVAFCIESIVLACIIYGLWLIAVTMIFYGKFLMATLKSIF